MNVGLDLDGTITRCPEFFSAISRALIDGGHKIYIVTWREDREFALEDLAEHGITYTELVLPTEREIHGATAVTWKAAAAQWKAEICRSMQIDLFFDDMPEVVNCVGAWTTAFIALDPPMGTIAYQARA